jgi:diguanylate cyclase (GGDEF)-like protein
MTAANYAMQLAGALVVLLFLSHFHQRYRRPYVRDWLLSWGALSIAVGAETLMVRFPGAPRAVSITLWFFICTASVLQIFWLTTATRTLARMRAMETQEYRRALLLCGAAAIAFSALCVTLKGAAFEPFSLTASLSLGLCAVICGAIILRRRRGPEASAFVIYATALILYGVEHLLRTVVSAGGPMLWGGADLVLQTVVALAMIITVLEDERESAVHAVAEVEHLAFHDALTGLPNRVLLFDRIAMAIAHAARQKQRVALLFLDLDRFKVINDSLGHSVGDTLLKVAADRIRRCVRQEDTLARFGGDEFVVLMPLMGRAEDAAKVAQKIIDVMSAPALIAGREITATPSVGIAIYPTDAPDAEALVKNADVAMYRAKDEGRAGYRFYAPAMNARTLEMLEMETALRRALQQSEFLMHYQPLVDVATGSIYGLEALLRWRHPLQGVIGPDRFMALAESTGLIVPIGNWVLHESCRQARYFQRQLGADLVMSVNLSAKQLQQGDLIDQVRSALSEASLRPRSLELEITETTDMHDIERTIRLLRELKLLGVRIAIDDFGTGYSSLSYLKQLPVDTLKLDQSFVREITVPEDGAIAKGVIAMAHSLELKVVAEGVETLGQLDFLRSHACDRLQGFLFSRPLEASIFERFYHQNGRMIRVA